MIRGSTPDRGLHRRGGIFQRGDCRIELRAPRLCLAQETVWIACLRGRGIFIRARRVIFVYITESISVWCAKCLAFQYAKQVFRRSANYAGARDNQILRPPFAHPDTSSDGISACGLRELKGLTVYTRKVMAIVAHHEDMLNYLEYAHAATNTQLQSRLEGKKMTMIPNTCKGAMRLPEVKQWRAAAGKEVNSLKELRVYFLVPSTRIPQGDQVKMCK